MNNYDFVEKVFKLFNVPKYPGENLDIKLKLSFHFNGKTYKHLSIWIDDDDDCRGRILDDLYEEYNFVGTRLKLYELSSEKLDELFEICEQSK